LPWLVPYCFQPAGRKSLGKNSAVTLGGDFDDQVQLIIKRVNNVVEEDQYVLTFI